MSFYICDNCKYEFNYDRNGEPQYEIIKLDLKFCSYNCLMKYFKNLKCDEK